MRGCDVTTRVRLSGSIYQTCLFLTEPPLTNQFPVPGTHEFHKSFIIGWRRGGVSVVFVCFSALFLKGQFESLLFSVSSGRQTSGLS